MGLKRAAPRDPVYRLHADGLFAAGCTPSSWIHIALASGRSPYVYSARCKPFGAAHRDGTISVRSRRHLRLLMPMPCAIGVAVSPQQSEFEHILRTSNYSGCSWSASAGASSLSLSPVQGRGSGTVVVDPASVFSRCPGGCCGNRGPAGFYYHSRPRPVLWNHPN